MSETKSNNNNNNSASAPQQSAAASAAFARSAVKEYPTRFDTLCRHHPHCTKGAQCQFIHTDVCLAFLSSHGCENPKCQYRHLRVKPCRVWLESANCMCECPFAHQTCTRFALTHTCARGDRCAAEHTDLSIPVEVNTSLYPPPTDVGRLSRAASSDPAQGTGPRVQYEGTYTMPEIDPKWDATQLYAYRVLKQFVESDELAVRTKPGSRADERAVFHRMADLFGLRHQAVAKGWMRGVLITRMSVAEFKRRDQPVVATLPPAEPSFDVEQKQIYDTLKAFVLDESAREFMFPFDSTASFRKKIHQLAMDFELEHEAIGSRGTPQRSVLVRKVPANVLAQRRQVEANLATALKEYASKTETLDVADHDDSLSSPHGTPAPDDEPPVTPPPSANTVRYVSFNIEWMDYLFASDTAFLTSHVSADIDDVAQLCANIAFAVRTLAPDLMAVVEGPSTPAKMDLFQKTYLNNEFDVICNDDLGMQSIYFLVRRNGPVTGAALFEAGDQFLRQEWRIDTQGDYNLAEYGFTRRPLVIKALAKLGGAKEPQPFYAIAMHTKSKFIGGGQRLWESTEFVKKLEFIRKAVTNRRRIGAECLRVRQMIDQVIYNENKKPLVVVSGDLNDGPGADFFEQLFLLVNPVDLVMGTPFVRSKLLQALLIRRRYVPVKWQWSAEFNDYVDKVDNKRVLLDHIMLSNDLVEHAVCAGIAHDVYRAAATTSGNPLSRQNRVSDHVPVYCDLK
jgi:hypothetical protein